MSPSTVLGIFKYYSIILTPTLQRYRHPQKNTSRTIQAIRIHSHGGSKLWSPSSSWHVFHMVSGHSHKLLRFIDIHPHNNGVNQGPPEKQNLCIQVMIDDRQVDRQIDRCMDRQIGRKEIGSHDHMILKAEKSLYLQSASWRPRRTDGISSTLSLKTGKIDAPAQRQSGRERKFSLTPPFCSIQAFN